MLPRLVLLVTNVVTMSLSLLACLQIPAAADAREIERGGRLPVPKLQLPRAAPPTMPPSGSFRTPDIPRPDLGGRGGGGSPTFRPEPTFVCIGGRPLGRSCLCADGSSKPALGVRVVRCPNPMRRR